MTEAVHEPIGRTFRLPKFKAPTADSDAAQRPELPIQPRARGAGKKPRAPFIPCAVAFIWGCVAAGGLAWFEGDYALTKCLARASQGYQLYHDEDKNPYWLKVR